MTFVIIRGAPDQVQIHHLAPKASRPIALAAMALTAAMGLACGRAQADADAIKTLVSREAAAINRKDMQALSQIWSQDKNILLFDVPPPGRFKGWDQIGRQWKDFFDRVSDIRLTVDLVEAQTQGSLGYATYDWSMTGRLGTYALEDRGQATAIYRKEGGQWRLVHAHYSPVPPALAGLERPAVQPASGGAATPGKGTTPAPATAASPAGAGSPPPAAKAPR